MASSPCSVGNQGRKPILAHLLAKRTDFIAEDRAKADRPAQGNREGDDEGQSPHRCLAANPHPVQGQMGAEVYADRANSIGRENRIIE
jgi:hypothetical protein